MRRLRRLARHLALPLGLLLPGLGGTWLQEAHPCPVEHAAAGHAGHGAPAAEGSGHGQHVGAGDHGSQDGGTESQAPSCTCIGACGQGTAPAAPTPIAFLSGAVGAFTPVQPAVPAWLPVFTPTDFLPLSTAPPHA
ncbi:MAG TPA: hypothetical protein VFX50_17355 [Gemmatimonadales bacterium]|nr:hypothetical protein [Gemmatimonadales bacterium]